ncbi:MauE/DoxX family redox-associated membrane protein [Desulfoluna spongiiphila]|uniref:MauE/DoxX family redox-associated membrane protein n=1 Tax=Desulfoluna spongiiphila TaxID=419481 RepID=UPI00125B76B6|nr:MauE/DoxX family redox-associated membrane protein [Desulfoluna spongiiphila]VVS93866.1 methylamine utilisation protein maue [Desulfoluna spongiiphila]
MTFFLKNRWVYRGLRLFVAGIFLWSGVGKLMDQAAFAVVIDAFGILPEGFSGLVAVVLPVVEVAAGLALVFDLRGALGTLFVLMLCFMAILGYGIYLGLDIDCGCFGPEDPESRAFGGLRTALYRDVVFCGFMGLVALSRRLRRGAEQSVDVQGLDPRMV